MQVKTLLKLSIAAAVATIAMKSLAWWITDSVGLLSDAMESFVNLASALFALLMVTIAQRPADDDHPFGHTKAEYFSSGFEGMLIAGAAAGIIWAAVHRFGNPQPLESLGWGLALSAASSAINWALAHRMLAVSREQRSIALEADARHLYTDVWTSAGVIGGLVLVHLTGWLWLDPVLAIGVALNILREGAHLAWRSVEGLMDTAVEPEVRAQIDRTLAQFDHHAIRFDHIVTRRAAQRRFVDLHMHLPADWSLGRAAALRADVEQALTGEVPGLRASIQLLPTNVEAQVDTLPAESRGRFVIALVQRVARAEVLVGGACVGKIAQGLLVFVCAEPPDTEALADKLVAKLLKLRIFADGAGKMNLSVADVQGGLLVVSQFTLAADVSGGNRPSFTGAASPELGRQLYERVVATARAMHPTVASGEFGADMRVELVNDGPVTIPITLRH